MKKLLSLMLALAPVCTAMAQDSLEVTATEARTLYKSVTKKWVSVHDPSVVWEPSSKRYYIFGSHRGQAYTTDLQNWTSFNSPWKVGTNNNAANNAAFIKPAVKKVTKGGAEVDFPQFSAYAWSAAVPTSGDGGEWNINGNMWAPDVIYNPQLKKWCQYLSINGFEWNSSIILLTSDKIEGPYEYQGPVVITGFKQSGDLSYKNTDLELVLGTQSSLPSRYRNSSGWASTRYSSWPHAIDPCVFYDEQGQLWMAYGSWSGGIWILQLNEQTGLRDYDVTYSVGTNSDPYFGKRIAGGYYASGEGAYIEHIGQHYFLFVSYGGLTQAGGYEMRTFRSSNPDGPYTDVAGRSPVNTGYTLNFGPKAAPLGEKLLGPYSHWGFMPQGERAQGHNSIIAAEDGRTYLVYHTRFCNDDKKVDEGHQVRVHQVLLNKNGWLVAAPFEYGGETTTDADIASQQPFTANELAGTYSLLIHKFANDHANLEQVEPVKITLDANGTVTGDKKGTWAIDTGTAYIRLTLGGIIYNGVVMEKVMDYRNVHAIAISGVANSGETVWAYKMHPKYEVAWHLNNQSVPVSAGQIVSRDVNLYGMDLGLDNVTLQWTSSQPSLISEYGKYNPTGLTEDTPLQLTARLAAAQYYWQQQYNVKAAKEALPSADWETGMVAHYGFDTAKPYNSYSPAQVATLARKSNTAVPTIVGGDPLRTGSYVHLNAGANAKESYVEIDNPLYGQDLSDGATLSFWVRRADNNMWDALFGATNGTARLYLTGNLYCGYNDGAGTWLDINHPETVETDELTVGQWQLLTIVITPKASSSSGGVTFYINSTMKRNDRFNGKAGDTSISTKQAFDYSQMLALLSKAEKLYLGNGSFWGSPNADFDDFIVYNRPLSLTQVMALNNMENRVFDFAQYITGIGNAPMAVIKSPSETPLYDLQGRRANSQQPKRGLYILNGRKVVIK
jgi:arabinan endo-1,5-alpha-L-arabinosidase